MKEKENEKIVTRKSKKVRKISKHSQETKNKISATMKKYWSELTLIDENGNVIERKEKK